MLLSSRLAADQTFIILPASYKVILFAFCLLLLFGKGKFLKTFSVARGPFLETADNLSGLKTIVCPQYSLTETFKLVIDFEF